MISSLLALVPLGTEAVPPLERTAEGWGIETVDSVGDVGRFASLDVDLRGKAHISYWDQSNDDLIYATNANGSWERTVVDGSGAMGEHTSLAVDERGKAHISYYDTTYQDLRYATNENGVWIVLTVDDASNVGKYSSLALDLDGNVHISYYDEANGHLKYANNSAGWFQTYTVDSTANRGAGTSIAVDVGGVAHISYYDASSGDLRYATNAGGSWSDQLVNGTGMVGSYSSIGVDYGGTAHIAFFDATDGDLEYASNLGGSWNTLTLDSMGVVGGHTSLEVDQYGYVRISYFDDTNDDLKYAIKEGGSWTTYTIDGPGSVGWYTSLALDDQRSVHIAYYDIGNGDLKYATDSIWYKETVDRSANVGQHNSIALDPQGFAHISYYDLDSSNLKYANNVGGEWSTFTVCPYAGTGLYSSIAMDDGVVHISHINSINDDLLYTTNSGGGWTTYVVDPISDVDWGTSIDVDADGVVHISYFDGGGGALMYANNSGGVWTSLPVDEGDGDVVGRYSSLALGPDGLVHISYWDSTSADLKYINNTGGDWTPTVIDSSGIVGAGSSIDVDQWGKVHISYYDTTNSNLKYATDLNGYWYNTTVDAVGDVGVSSSIGVDQFGNAHISYYDATNLNLRYANNIGTGWSTGTIVSGWRTGPYTSLDLDANGKAHISYFNSADGTLGYLTDAPWRLSLADTVGNVGWWTSLAVDGEGRAHIAYYDVTNHDLKYATNAEGGWVAETVDAAGDIGNSPSIALDSEGNVHIVYVDAVLGDLLYAHNIGGGWTTSTIDGENYTSTPSLAIDPQDHLHISYVNQDDHVLVYATNAGGDWELVVVDDGVEVGPFTSLAIDAEGAMHIAYYDQTNGDLRYATNAGTSWAMATVDDSADDVGYYVSIALDQEGKAHIAYQDHDIMVLKYATNAAGDWVVSVADSSVGSGIWASIGVDGQGRPHIAHKDNTVGGVMYTTLSLGSWSSVAVHTGGWPGEFASFSLDPDGRAHISYYDAQHQDLRYAELFAEPSTPMDLQGTALGDSTAYLTWSPPLFDHGFQPIAYKIFRGTSPGSYEYIAGGNVLEYYDIFLDHGTYYYTVTALNAVGEGAMCEPVVVSLIVPPSAPRSPGAQTSIDGALYLSWVAPEDLGGADSLSYYVYQSLTSGGPYDHVSTTEYTSVTIGFLVPGLTYYFKVSAVNSAGEGPVSTQFSGVPTGPASAPRNLTATLGSDNITLEWDPPISYGTGGYGTAQIHRGTVSGGETYLDYVSGETLSYEDRSVVPGQTYYYKVVISNTEGLGQFSNEASALFYELPGAPTGLTAQAGDAQVSLNWTAPSSDGGAAIGHYVVYRNGEDIAHVAGLSYTDTGRTNGVTYTYAVAAHNAAGTGPQSSAAQATPFTLPGAPTGLLATPGNAQVNLTWVPPADDGGESVDYYLIYRNGTYYGPATGTYFIDFGVVNGFTYTYQMRAVNAAGAGPNSSSVQAVPRTIPGAPTGLMATPGDSQVSLLWSAPADDGGADIDHYIVYRDSVDVGHTSSTSFVDPGLTNGVAYDYTVAAHNAAGTGNGSSPVQAVPFTVPGAPVDLQATPGDAFINLTWSEPVWDGGNAIDNYQVWRGTNSGSETFWADAGENTWFNDTGLVNGEAYYYLVRAENAAGPGPGSDEVNAVPSPDVIPPSAPLNLEAVAGNLQVTLHWDPPANNGGSPISGYRVYRGTAPGGETFLTTVGKVTVFVNGGLTNGQTYYYRLSALNSVGEGALSIEVSAVPATVPEAPTDLQGVPGDAQVSLTWTAPEDNGASIDYYIVYCDDVDIGHPSGTSYVSEGLTNGLSYIFTVSAHNSVGDGPSSASVNVTPYTLPGAPTDLAVAPGNARASLVWSAPLSDGGALIDYYIVYRDGVDVAHTSATYHNDTELTNGVLYEYAVAAHNAAGIGPSSGTIEVTPFTRPGAPTDLLASVNHTQVLLTWSTPADDGGAAIDHYLVYRDGEELAQVTTTSYTYMELEAGTRTYAVAAHNAAGMGDLSSSLDVPFSDVPSAPLDLQATPGDGQMLLTWSLPEVIGVGTLTYHLFRDGVEVWNGTNTNHIDTGLVKGVSYVYTVAASNAAGLGENGTDVQVVAVGAPDAPGGLTAEALDGEVSLGWTAPAYAGPGTLIYHVFRDGVEVWRGTATTYLDRGLVNENTYSYTVAASNSIGRGENSTAVSATPVLMDQGEENLIMFILIVMVVITVGAIAVIWFMRRKQ